MAARSRRTWVSRFAGDGAWRFPMARFGDGLDGSASSGGTELPRAGPRREPCGPTGVIRPVPRRSAERRFRAAFSPVIPSQAAPRILARPRAARPSAAPSRPIEPILCRSGNWVGSACGSDRPPRRPPPGCTGDHVRGRGQRRCCPGIRALPTRRRTSRGKHASSRQRRKAAAEAEGCPRGAPVSRASRGRFVMAAGPFPDDPAGQPRLGSPSSGSHARQCLSIIQFRCRTDPTFRFGPPCFSSGIGLRDDTYWTARSLKPTARPTSPRGSA